MQNAIEIKNLTKRYSDFNLDRVNITLPSGCIMGFIGENGAGKSTTIKSILNLINKDSGEILVFGQDSVGNEKELKQQIGVVLDESFFPDSFRVNDVNLIMKNTYQEWDDRLFKAYTEQFSLPPKKRIKEYSRGMKVKLNLAVALSHKAKLLILDEATSGLDPIARDEILDVFLAFTADENHSIFISSHIVSDLEKICDYITFIHKGKIMFSETKEELLDNYRILKCSHSVFEQLDKSGVKGYRKNDFGIEALVLKSTLKGSFVVDKASIENIMLYSIRGDAL